MPQLSLAVTSPHCIARRVQKAPLDSGAHPHALLMPPPPHVSGNVHGPQSTVRATLQLSMLVTAPHCFMSRVQKVAFDSLVQPGVPHRPAVPPPPQVAGEVHAPQSLTFRETPHTSIPLAGPHDSPSRAQNAASVSEHVPPPPPLPLPPPLPPSSSAPSTQKPPEQLWLERQSVSVMQRPRVSTMKEHPSPTVNASAKRPGTRRRRTRRAYSRTLRPTPPGSPTRRRSGAPGRSRSRCRTAPRRSRWRGRPPALRRRTPRCSRGRAAPSPRRGGTCRSR